LLKDVRKDIIFDKRGKFKYFFIPFFNIKGLEEFISNLDDESLYTVIPVLSMYGRNEDPHIILSTQILMSNYSDPKIISDYLNKQLEIAINDLTAGC
jgi:hypothetical protein